MEKQKGLALELAQMVTLETLYTSTDKGQRYNAKREGIEVALDIMGVSYSYERNDSGEVIAVVVEGERVEVIRP